jgi:hypothetical protein
MKGFCDICGAAGSMSPSKPSIATSVTPKSSCSSHIGAERVNSR